MIALYNLLLMILSPFWAIWMWLRTRARKEQPDWRERRGIYRNVPPPTADRPRVWIHAVSVGEVVAAMPILRELRRLHPTCDILLSVTTSSGHQTAREKAADNYDHLVYFPIDVARYTFQAILRTRPKVVAIMETELWMNFLYFAKEFRATTLLLNGRISDRSFPKSMKLRFFYRALLGKMDRCLMQTQVDAERITALGAQSVEVFGNCKVDEAMAGTDANPDEWRAKLGLEQGRKVIVVASTRGEEEEKLVFEALCGLPDVSIVYAPRHLERIPELRSLAEATLGSVSLRSEGGGGRFVLLDTYGELSQVFCVADVVIVGGGFSKLGGQNLIQPLAHGKPVIHGPYMHNFRDAAEAAARMGATRTCATSEELTTTLREILTNPELAASMGQKAKEYIQQNHGASTRYAEAIVATLAQ